MAKTVVSTFRSQEAATQVLSSFISKGFDSRQLSVIEAADEAEAGPASILDQMPTLQARIYRGDLKKGAKVFVARVSERDVARIIRLLQSTGGRHIEAFDSLPVS